LILISDRAEDLYLLAAYRKSTLIAIPIFLIIIGMGAWWIAKRGLAPLNTFRSLTSAVTTSELKGRIECQDLPFELNELADSVNLMLERLEDGVKQLADFSDNLAHELRSPITNLMGKAQVALSKNRTSDQYKETLESCVEELERVSRIVSDMLYLAQTTQADSAAYESLSLNKEANHIVNLFNAIAEEKRVRLSVVGDDFILGDKLMIQRAISNLLSNAIRHAPVDSSVPIEIISQSNQAFLSISNSGPGIPTQHLHKIFERFYRVDSGRSRAEGGIGLGLAMVRTIMEFHHGTVTVESDIQGPTKFTLTFRKINHD
jgi:two-component system heavy metal sensor histidine kinase CusS